jgi:hypothetical protein
VWEEFWLALFAAHGCSRTAKSTRCKTAGGRENYGLSFTTR